jgi:hypothetical protein
MIEVLANYAFFLQQMLRTQCDHFVEVHNFTRQFKSMMARMVVTVMWHVFIDARGFFAWMIDLNRNLPSSTFRVA